MEGLPHARTHTRVFVKSFGRNRTEQEGRKEGRDLSCISLLLLLLLQNREAQEKGKRETETQTETETLQRKRRERKRKKRGVKGSERIPIYTDFGVD